MEMYGNVGIIKLQAL